MSWAQKNAPVRGSWIMTTVIKAGEAGPILHRLAAVDLADHLAEAEGVIASADRKAQQIVSQAQAKADDLNVVANQQGYDDGFAKGQEEGTQAGAEKAYQEAVARFAEQQQALIDDLARAVEQIDQVKEELSIRAEQDLLDFAVQLASKLTFAIGLTCRESAQENFKKALRMVGSKTDLTLKVHPKDCESLKRFAPSVLESLGASPTVSIVEDSSLHPGGCMLQTQQTSVDASLETQLDELVALLLGHRSREVQSQEGGECDN